LDFKTLFVETISKKFVVQVCELECMKIYSFEIFCTKTVKALISQGSMVKGQHMGASYILKFPISLEHKRG